MRISDWRSDVCSSDLMLPSYLPQPNAFKPQARSFERFLDDETIPTGWWNNFPKYITSLLRAWYGDAVGPHNEWGYQWLPKIVGDHSQLALTLAMDDGIVRGLFLMGQTVVIGGSNSSEERRVGTECVRTCSPRGSPYNKQKKHKQPR